MREGLKFTLPVLVLAGCGGISLWPFGESGPTEVGRKPANATEYRCEGARSFYVRSLEGGAVWLIAPDREIRLERIGGPESARYGVGRIVLELSSEAATLSDPPATYAGCKRAG